MTRSWKKWTREDRARLARMTRAGYSRAAIAAALGRSVRSIAGHRAGHTYRFPDGQKKTVSLTNWELRRIDEMFRKWGWIE